MHIALTVDVAVERETGQFASRDELVDSLRGALEDADPGVVFTEGGAEYVVHNWDVTEVDTRTRKARP